MWQLGISPNISVENFSHHFLYWSKKELVKNVTILIATFLEQKIISDLAHDKKIRKN